MSAKEDIEYKEETQYGTDDSRGLPKRSLPLVAPNAKVATASELDVEAELAAFESAERERLGINADRQQWTDEMIDSSFKKSERASTTLLVCGLTMAHDLFVEAGLKGIGYNVLHIDVPNNDALQYGKEFGNRGQCNPTYYTVGNLVKYLCELRDKQGMSTKDIIKSHVFLTAGACGPCRFGMYVTEYRKALRDAGFDGFRVMLFQQTGGFKQATGDDVGLEMNPKFFITLAKCILIGDVINALTYRIRPYEMEQGATDKALANAKKIVYQALSKRTSLIKSLLKVRKEFEQVKVNKLQAKPKVSIIGEFWAMTTEGDGNYQLHRFLEGEGGEPDIQLVTAWMLYMIWEGQRDTLVRQDLRGTDKSLYGLGGLGTTGIAKRLATLRVAELTTRVVFQAFAKVGGLSNYHLPDMNEIAEVSDKYYSNDLRGGEGHMEVGKLILNSINKKAHMTISVKPFGCMPSASVSDGVQSMITEKFPGSIFCAVETSGDGRVNFYSRIQMYMFKARAAAEAELEITLNHYKLTRDEVEAFLRKHPRYASSLHRPNHVVAGAAADLVHEVAPLIQQSVLVRTLGQVKNATSFVKQQTPIFIRKANEIRSRGPELLARLRADAEVLTDLARGSMKDLGPLAASVFSKALTPQDSKESTNVSSGVSAAKAVASPSKGTEPKATYAHATVG